MIDLHTHSSASDGSLSPSALIEEAAKRGLSVIALTDHDTVNGLEEAALAARERGIDFIPGIELEVIWEQESGGEFHLLGLGINRPSPYFLATVEELGRRREERNLEIVEKINQKGIPVSYDEIKALAVGPAWSGGPKEQPGDSSSIPGVSPVPAGGDARFRGGSPVPGGVFPAGCPVPDGVFPAGCPVPGISPAPAGETPRGRGNRGHSVGRPHFAAFLIKRKIVKNSEQAFRRYLGRGKPFYIPKAGLEFERAAAAIKESGGIAVLAHPMSLYVAWGRLPDLVKNLKERGLDGLEAWHPTAKVNACRRLEELGKKLDLYITAGSDFHGAARPDRKLGITAGGKKIDDSFLGAWHRLDNFSILVP